MKSLDNYCIGRHEQEGTCFIFSGTASTGCFVKIGEFCKGLTDILQADDKSGVHRIIPICQLFEKAVTSKNFENNAPLSAISESLLNSLGDRLFAFLKDIPLIFFATLPDHATKMSFVNTASSKLFFEKQCKHFGLVNNLQCKEWICQMLLRCLPKDYPKNLGNLFLNLSRQNIQQKILHSITSGVFFWVLFIRHQQNSIQWSTGDAYTDLPFRGLLEMY